MSYTSISYITWPVWLFCFILGNIALTVLADAGTVPRQSKESFWHHWWHIPLLTLANFGVYYIIFFTFYKFAYNELIFIQEAFFTILSYIITSATWIKLTYNTDTRTLIPATTIPLGIILTLDGLYLLTYGSTSIFEPIFYAQWHLATTTYITTGTILTLFGISLTIFIQIYNHLNKPIKQK